MEINNIIVMLFTLILMWGISEHYTFDLGSWYICECECECDHSLSNNSSRIRLKFDQKSMWVTTYGKFPFIPFHCNIWLQLDRIFITLLYTLIKKVDRFPFHETFTEFLFFTSLRIPLSFSIVYDIFLKEYSIIYYYTF